MTPDQKAALESVVARTRHERYRQLCDETHPAYHPGCPDQMVELAAELAGTAPPPAPGAPEPAAAAAPHAGPCAFLGPPVLDPGGRQATRQCPTCRGVVRLKLSRCHHPGHAADPTTTEAGCRDCGDWAAPPAP